MHQTVAASFVSALRDFAIERGAAPGDLDRLSVLDPPCLANPDARLPLDKYEMLVKAAQALTGDPALALHFGEAADFAELSIVGLMGEASGNLGQAFEALNRYSRLAIDVELDEAARGQRMVVEQSGGEHWLVDTRKNPNDFPEITESGFARMINVARRSGTLEFIAAVHFTHSPPAYADEYRRVFPMPVMFNSRRNAFLMRDGGWAIVKPRLPSPYMADLLRARAETLVQAMDHAGSTRAAVEKLLIASLGRGEVEMSRIARQLGVSRTTLFRRLRAEGMTFGEILKAVRFSLARRHLARDKLSIATTSQLLGYSDQASFSHAFKRWTGQSPRHYSTTNR